MSHSRLTENQRTANSGFIFFLIFLIKNHQFFLVVDFKQVLGVSQLFLINNFTEPGIVELKVWLTERRKLNTLT